MSKSREVRLASSSAALRGEERAVGVMQISDTLAVGGAERVAVNLANLLPRGEYRSHLCTTREEGPLAGLLTADVGRLLLNRRSRFEPGALRRLRDYIARHDIRILHAHGTALFIALAAAGFRRGPAVLWHDHFGPNSEAERSVGLYRLAARRAAGVIVVSEALAEWSRARLGLPSEKVWYVPNFVCESEEAGEAARLPGVPGFRVVCVANLRSEKGHAGLLEAMRLLRRDIPEAHLLLVGEAPDSELRARLEAEMARPDLAGAVTWLGARDDVPAILKACDAGVLNSSSEGLPLSLIEYGLAGLPAVSTDVGQCAEVLDGGRAGLLVPPGAPEALARALASLLRDPAERNRLAQRALPRARDLYGPERALGRIREIYEAVLKEAR